MPKFPHAKISFVSSLQVKHSKHGARSVIDKLIMSNIEKLSFNSESDDVLDVGCGTGYGTVLIGSRVRSIVGIETDAGKLAVAQRDYNAENATYIKVGSLEDLGESALSWRESFDKVVSLCPLFFVQDVEAVVGNIKACLKPGGESLIIMPHDDHNLFQGALDFIKNHDEWTNFMENFDSPLCLWKYKEEETRDLYRTSGWSEVDCELQRVDVILDQKKAKLVLWDMLHHIDKVDTDKREQCLEDLWQWCLKEYKHTEDGSIIKPADFMVVHARK